MEHAAGVCERAWRAPDRRSADLRGTAGRRPPRPPAPVPERLGRGDAAGRVLRRRPALGQPALRLAGDAARRLPVVARADAADVRALRPGAHRPLPRLRRLLGGAGEGAYRTARSLE